MERLRKLSARLSPPREERQRRSSSALVTPSKNEQTECPAAQLEQQQQQQRKNSHPLVARSPSAKVSPSSSDSSSSSQSKFLLQPDQVSSVIRRGDASSLKAFLTALKSRSRVFKQGSMFHVVHSLLVMCADAGNLPCLLVVLDFVKRNPADVRLPYDEVSCVLWKPLDERVPVLTHLYSSVCVHS